MPGLVEDGGWDGQEHGQRSPKAPGGLVSKLAGRFGGGTKTSPLLSNGHGAAPRTVPLVSADYVPSKFVAVGSDFASSSKGTSSQRSTDNGQTLPSGLTGYQFVTSPPPTSKLPSKIQISAPPEPECPLQIDNLQETDASFEGWTEVETAIPFRENVNKFNIAASSGKAAMPVDRKLHASKFVTPKPTPIGGQPQGSPELKSRAAGLLCVESKAAPNALPSHPPPNNTTASATRSGASNRTNVQANSNVNAGPVGQLPPSNAQYHTPETRKPTAGTATPGRKRPPGALAPPKQPAMWHIVGAKHPVFIEVPCTASSISSYGVYMIWVPATQQGPDVTSMASVYLWHSARASPAERVKALEVGSSIRELEHATKAAISRVEQGEHDAGLSAALGLPAAAIVGPSAPPTKHPCGAASCKHPALQAEFDAATWEEKTWRKTVVVRFEGEEGAGFRREVQERPLRRSLLTSPAAAVLVACPGIRLFVWLGKHSSEAAAHAAQAEALKLGKGALTQVVVQGWEPTLLRALCVDWMTPLGAVARNNGGSGTPSSPLAIDGARLAKASGGTLATRGGNELVRVFGRKLVMAMQVEPAAASVGSRHHCYVLVTKGVVYQRNAVAASPQARAKAAQLSAAFVQAQAGRAVVKVLDGDEDIGGDSEAFWKELGGRPNNGGGGKLPGRGGAAKFQGGGPNEGEDDERAWGRVRLLRIRGESDGRGEAVERPFKQSVLGSHEAFVLAWEGVHLFVWTGGAAPVGLKQQAYNMAAALQKQWGQLAPSHPVVSIQAAPEHAEPPVFQFHFQGWVADSGSTEEGRQGHTPGGGKATWSLGREVSGGVGGGGKITPAALNREWSTGSTGGGEGCGGKDKSTVTLEERAGRVDVRRLEGRGALLPALVTPAIRQDDGSLSTVRLWSVKHGRLVEEEAQRPLVLSSGKCYALLYSYCPGVDRRERRHILYAWHGARAGQQERAASTMCLNEVAATVRGQGSQDREVVQEGKESWHFALACGGLAVRAAPDVGQAPGRGGPGPGGSGGGGGGGKGGPRMFHVRALRREVGAKAVGSAVEVQPSASALCSRDCFVLLLEGSESAVRRGQYGAAIWRGAVSSEEEAQLAMALAGRMLQKKEESGWERHVMVEKEGREKAGFWSLIGGQQPYAKLAMPGGPMWTLRRMSEDEDMPSQGDSWKALGKGSGEGETEERLHGGVLRLFHLEAAGSLVHPKEVPTPVPGDLHDAAWGACLVHFASPLDPLGRAYVWVNGTPRGGMSVEKCQAIGAAYLTARSQRLVPANTGHQPPAVAADRLQAKVVMAGTENAEFTSCFLGWQPA